MNLSDNLLTDAAHLNWLNFYREFSTNEQGGAVREEDGYLLFTTAARWAGLHSGIFRLRESADPEIMVSKARKFFEDRELGFTVFSRKDKPADKGIDVAAERAGMKLDVEHDPAMVCLNRVEMPKLHAGVELRVVSTEREANEFVDVLARTWEFARPQEVTRRYFGNPEWIIRTPHYRAMLGLLDGQPVSGVVTYLSSRVGGVYMVSTTPEARGFGIGTAITAAATNAAFDMGAVAACLQADPLAIPMYERIGYRELFAYRRWVPNTN